MTRYFRTVMKAKRVQPRDEDGHPTGKAKTVITYPVAVALDLTLEQLSSLEQPGLMHVKLHDGRVLDLFYRHAASGDEVLNLTLVR